ncbi:Adenylate cyclase type 10 [Blyttiomyces sp. JEL0837]|nr:Adenylate cyclase type 10 [Blyttiomyces sp. JEL0837]
MADVSGYSSLSSTLAERGPSGAELLGSIMKGYLDKIIAIILDHGGDIVKFAGDAVIVYWKLPPGSDASSDIVKGELVLKASHCCMDLLNSLGTYDIDILECPTKVLRIHLGIGAGPLYDVHVGGESGRWEHFIAGDAIRQLSHVLDLAKAGELAMSHTALKWFSCVIDIDTMNIGDYDKRCIIVHGLEKAKRKVPQDAANVSFDVPDMSDNPDCMDFMKMFINDSAIFKLQADINQSKLFKLQADLINLLNLYELRQVTTVFIRLGEYLSRWEKQDSLDAAQRIILIVQRALKKYEGSLRQFHVDDKGAVILAFFGLPPLAHQNDASYGVKAVLEIREKMLAELEEFSIGITTGVVSIGGVGFNNRAEYAVMGDSINMAARLMCHPEAQGSVLCDEKTYNLCESEFIFEKLGETRVKGKASAISIFRPNAVRVEANRMARRKVIKKEDLIGRDEEKMVIQSTLQSFEDEDGANVVILEADGGQGLSTLVDYTKEQSVNFGCYSCSGGATEMEKSTPFFAFRDLITDMLLIIEDADVDEHGAVIPRFDKFRASYRGENVGDNGGCDPIFASGTSDLVITPSSPGKSNTMLNSNSYESAEEDFGSLKDKTKGFRRVFSVRRKPSAKKGELLFRNKLMRSGSEAFVTSDSGILPRSSSSQRLPNDGPLETRLRNALSKMREPPQLAPLFDLIWPPEFSAEPMRQGQAKVRIKELGELLRRLFSTLSRTCNLVLIFYEVQYMDTLSWELLWDLVSYCMRMPVYIFSRPERSYENEDCVLWMRKFKRLTRTISIVVEGLDFEHTREMVISSWPGQILKGVVDPIVENIYKRTNGNPLYIRSLVVALKESGQWRIDEQGILCTQFADFDFEKVVIGYDLKSIMVAQFDRLDRNFQLLLKVSSVLGQRFAIDDVFHFLTDMPGFREQYRYPDLEKVSGTIEEMDKYGFLERVEGDLDTVIFQFKSEVVRRCVYGMMIDSQRQQLHLNIAEYYETILNPSNYHKLLIPLYEHFIETDDGQDRKKLKYLQEVAHFYFQKHSMTEAIKHYRLLIEKVREYEDRTKDIIFDQLTEARCNRELGEAFFMRRETFWAKEYLFASLKLLNYVFPTSSFSLYVRTKKEMALRAKFTIPSNADSNSTLPFKETMWGRMTHLHPLRARREIFGSHSSVPGSSYPAAKGNSTSYLYIVENILSKEPSLDMINDPKGMERSESHIDVKDNWVESALNMSTGESLSDEAKIELARVGNDPALARLFNVKLSLMTLAQVFLLNEEMAECKFAVLWGLNISEKFRKTSLYARFLAFAGFLFWIYEGRRGLALKYLDAADHSDLKTDLHCSALVLFYTGKTLFLMGIWTEAMYRYETVLQLNPIAGDVTMREEAMRIKSILMFHLGPQAVSAIVARDLYALSNQEAHSVGKFWGCFMILANLLSTASSLEEIQDMKRALDSLWETAPMSLTSDVTIQLAKIGLLMDCDFRLGLGLPPASVWRELESLTKHVKPYNWLAAMAFIHVVSCLHAFYVGGNATLDKPTRRAIDRFLRSVNTCLKKLKCLSMAGPLRAINKGFWAFLLGNRTLAVRRWKKGLECRGTERMFYLQAMLHERIGRYCDNVEESRENLAEAQKKFRKIGATWDVERITLTFK